MMLLLKRLATSAVLFPVLFVILFFGALIIGGAIVGARAGAARPEQGQEAGYEAGHEFGQRYSGIILLGACGGALVCSVAISFSRVFPWCRSKPMPPRLP